jgi:RNA polymerase sigma-70 factor (ECF subfamily)
MDETGQPEKERILKSWLFRIAYTTSVDFLRARRRTDELPDCLAEQAAKGRDPGISDEMRAALASLSVLDRAIVEERILMEMSYVEMADIHHLPAAALRKRYSRARQKLQKLLAKEEHHA